MARKFGKKVFSLGDIFTFKVNGRTKSIMPAKDLID